MYLQKSAAKALKTQQRKFENLKEGMNLWNSSLVFY